MRHLPNRPCVCRLFKSATSYRCPRSAFARHGDEQGGSSFTARAAAPASASTQGLGRQVNWVPVSRPREARCQHLRAVRRNQRHQQKSRSICGLKRTREPHTIDRRHRREPSPRTPAPPRANKATQFGGACCARRAVLPRPSTCSPRACASDDDALLAACALLGLRALTAGRARCLRRGRRQHSPPRSPTLARTRPLPAPAEPFPSGRSRRLGWAETSARVSQPLGTPVQSQRLLLGFRWSPRARGGRAVTGDPAEMGTEALAGRASNGWASQLACSGLAVHTLRNGHRRLQNGPMELAGRS